jgi:YcxB-like protein
MTIEYFLTSDFMKAMWNHFRGYTTISIANARILYVVAPTLSLTLLLTGIYSGYTWLKTPGSVFLFATLVSIPIHVGFDKWKFSNWFKGNISPDPEKERYRFIANEEGLIVAKLDSIETRVAWTEITKFRQDEVRTLIYLSPDNCFYLPTKAMTNEQRAELNDLVARHVARKKTC